MKKATQVKAMAFMLIIGAVVYSGLRHKAALNAEHTLKTMLNTWQDKGLKVSRGKITESGFPYRIILSVNDLSLRDPSGGFAFNSKKIALISHLWTPNHWMMNFNDVAANLADNNIAFTDQNIQASVRFDISDNILIAIDSMGADDFKASHVPLTKSPARLKNWLISFMIPKSRNDNNDDNSNGLYEAKIADFHLKLSGITLGDGERPYENIDSLDMLGSLSGKSPSSWDEKSLMKWSDGGGLVEFTSLNLAWGDAHIAGNGSFSFDQGTHPLGAFSLSLSGANTLANYIANVGITSRKNAKAIFPKSETSQNLSVMLQNQKIQVNGKTITATKPFVD